MTTTVHSFMDLVPGKMYYREANEEETYVLILKVERNPGYFLVVYLVKRDGEKASMGSQEYPADTCREWTLVEREEK